MSENKLSLCFDPDLHPDDTLRAFNDFIQTFQLRYDASYPDPPKVSMDSAMERWKIMNDDKKPTINDYDDIKAEWQAKDKVAKFLGLYSSKRMFSDWQLAEPDEIERKRAPWGDFVDKMKTFYAPTENLTLKHFQFRQLCQERNESFSAFALRIEQEAKHCMFSCESRECTGEMVSIRDQIVIGLQNEEIRQEALKNSWNLKELRANGTRLESAFRGAATISGEASVNKIGKYSFKNFKNEKEAKKSSNQKSVDCYFCGNNVSSLTKHLTQCPAKSVKCHKCGKLGHFAKVCRSKTEVKEVKVEVESDPDNEDTIYNVNIFRVTQKGEPLGSDFNVELIVNNTFDKILADTGAKISVCGVKEAKKWNILNKMVPANVKLKPYNSLPISVLGVSRCAVSFGKTSVPIRWHIIEQDCEPILAGKAAEQLGIIRFATQPNILQPMNMIQSEQKSEVQNIVKEHCSVFQGTGKLKNHQVILYVDKSVKPVVEPARTIPYHQQDRVDEIIKEMIQEDIIEERPQGTQVSWISNVVVAPKSDGDLRITIDARNLNKAICSTNLPIPKHEDIQAKLSGSVVFSKLDLKSAFWQLELHPNCRGLTTFHANDRLYQYKRLSMGLRPAQGELNAALHPLFSHLNDVHVIHDDIVLGASSQKEHTLLLNEVLSIIQRSGLTLNPKKCVFGVKEIEFWGLIFSVDGVKPDPKKVESLQHMETPKDKSELISFLCMMQSNSNFIPNFAKRASVLRDLQKEKKFVWEQKHQECFQQLVEAFSKEALLHYFDTSKNTYISVDAHRSGLGAILMQGNTIADIYPVAVASRTTSATEKRYPQIDLEALAVDFALRRFRNYTVGTPRKIIVLTDHKPLCNIFNGNKRGTIRAERVKLRHQEVQFSVEYQVGSKNQSDYLSRHAKPLKLMTRAEQSEADEVNNFLYHMHTTPITDCIDIGVIATHTCQDKILSELQKYIQKGQHYIEKSAPTELQKFSQILPEITITGNKILLKGEKIILPESLICKAIELAHRGGHPGQSGLVRRLRYHFYIPNLDIRVQEFVRKCSGCSTFVNKKTIEPIRHHKITDKNWQTVAVDLFGPMPSSHHVVVVQDLKTRFPAAKLVSSTKADKVIPVLEEIYDTYGHPLKQISDNGAPFNSQKMARFAQNHNIELQMAPPRHPSSNPVETFMRPLGKAMKIGLQEGKNEKDTLAKVLKAYQQTPHPATGIAPADQIFRDGIRSEFPRKNISEQDIDKAREKDLSGKECNEARVNSSKYRKASDIQLGDMVLVRNFDRRSKFEPLFKPVPYTVVNVNETRNKFQVKGDDEGMLIRHPDDLKPFYDLEDTSVDVPLECEMEYHTLQNCEMKFPQLDMEEYDGASNYFKDDDDNANIATTRKSVRERKPNTRYYNENTVTK